MKQLHQDYQGFQQVNSLYRTACCKDFLNRKVWDCQEAIAG